MIQSYRELRVWQKSFVLVRDIYAVTHQLPQEEQFGLTSQIRKCAVSIPSNIAEGQQRNNRKEYRQFLGIAKGSSAELETQLLLVAELYNIDCTGVLKEVIEIQKMLQALMDKLKINPNPSPLTSNPRGL